MKDCRMSSVKARPTFGQKSQAACQEYLDKYLLALSRNETVVITISEKGRISPQMVAKWAQDHNIVLFGAAKVNGKLGWSGHIHLSKEKLSAIITDGIKASGVYQFTKQPWMSMHDHEIRGLAHELGCGVMVKGNEYTVAKKK